MFILAPGPGAYTAFSEFGLYESKNAHENSGSGSEKKQNE